MHRLRNSRVWLALFPPRTPPPASLLYGLSALPDRSVDARHRIRARRLWPEVVDRLARRPRRTVRGDLTSPKTSSRAHHYCSGLSRSEEHTSELQSLRHLVC